MASNATLELIVSLKGDAAKQMRELGTETSNLHKQASGIGGLFSGIGGGLAKFGLAAGGIGAITGAVTGLTAGLLDGNAQMESYATQFEVLTGSGENAKKMMDDLKVMGAKTPFEFTDLAEGTQTLLAFGQAQKDIIPDLQMLGDISGGNKEKLKSLSLVFGQVASNGKLMGGDLLQMINAGFNPLNIIAQKTGKSMAELREDMSKGQISFEMVKDAMQTATSEGGQFFGMMDKQSGTFEGLTSTMADNFDALKRTLMQPIFDKVKEGLTAVVTFLGSPEVQNGVSAFASMLSEGIGQAMTAIGQAAAVVGPILMGAFQALGPAIGAILPILGQVAQFISDNLLPIGAGLATLIGTVIIPAFVAWASAAAASAAATIAALAPILIPIAAVAAAVLLLKTAWENNFLGIRDAVLPVVQKITDALSTFWTEVQPKLAAAWENIQQVVTTVMNTVSTVIGTVMTAIKTAWDSNWGGIRDIVKSVWDIISTTVKTVWEVVKGIITAGLALLSGDWKGAWEAISTTLNTAWEGMKTILKTALEMFGTIITQALPAIGTAIGTLAAKFIDWVANDVIPKLGPALKTIWDGIVAWVTQTVKDIGAKVGEIGGGIIDGIKNGISKAWQGLVDFLSSKVKDALPDFLKQWLGIASPSTVTAEMGDFLAQGLGEGFKKGEGAMLDDFRGVLGSMVAEILLAFDKEDEGSIRGGWDTGLNGMYKHLAEAWGPQTDIQWKFWLTRWKGYIDDFRAYVAANFVDPTGSLPPGGGGSGGTGGGGGSSGGGSGNPAIPYHLARGGGFGTYATAGAGGGGGGIHTLNINVSATPGTDGRAVGRAIAKEILQTTGFRDRARHRR